MNLTDDRAQLESYDSTLTVVGGLKDFGVIFKAFEAFFSSSDSVEQLIHDRNEFHLRTEKSRGRIERAVRKGFLHFLNQDHQNLIKGILGEKVPRPDKELALVWQYALNNRLFREITTNVFLKAYYSGRVGISKDDVAAYLKDFLQQNRDLQLSWSENTISTVATKYLNFMSKFGFLSPGRKKTFVHIRTSSEAKVLFLYFAELFSPDSRNILANEFLPMILVPREDLHDRLKKLSAKGLFNMDFNGVALNVELTHSYGRICDALYN